MTTTRLAKVAQDERQRNASIRVAQARRSSQGAAIDAAEATRLKVKALANADEAAIAVAKVAGYIGALAAKEVDSPKIAAREAVNAARAAIDLATAARRAADAVCSAEEKAVNAAGSARTAFNAAVVACATVERTHGADTQAALQVTESAEAVDRSALEVRQACDLVKQEADNVTDALANAHSINPANPTSEMDAFNSSYENARNAILFLTGLGLTTAVIIETGLIDKIINFINGSETVRKGFATAQFIGEKIEPGVTVFGTAMTLMAAAKVTYNFIYDQCGDSRPAYIAAAFAAAAAAGAVQAVPLIRPAVSTVNATYNFMSKELKLSSKNAALIAAAMGITVVGATYFIPIVGQFALAVSGGYSAYAGAHFVGDLGYSTFCAESVATAASENEIDGAWDWLDAPQNPSHDAALASLVPAIAKTATAAVNNVDTNAVIIPIESVASVAAVIPQQVIKQNDVVAERDSNNISKSDHTNKAVVSDKNVELSTKLMSPQQLLQKFDTTESKKSSSLVSCANRGNHLMKDEVLTSRILAHKERIMKRMDVTPAEDSKKSYTTPCRMKSASNSARSDALGPITKANNLTQNELLTLRITAHKERLMKNAGVTEVGKSSGEKVAASSSTVVTNQYRYFTQQKRVNSSQQRNTLMKSCSLQSAVVKRN